MGRGGSRLFPLPALVFNPGFNKPVAHLPLINLALALPYPHWALGITHPSLGSVPSFASIPMSLCLLMPRCPAARWHSGDCAIPPRLTCWNLRLRFWEANYGLAGPSLASRYVCLSTVMLYFKNGVSTPFEVSPSLVAHSPLCSLTCFSCILSYQEAACVCAQLLSCVWLFATPWTSLAGSPVHGIFQARILEWVAISFSWGSSQPRNQTRTSCVSYIAGGFFTTVPPSKPNKKQYREVIRSTLDPDSLGFDCQFLALWPWARYLYSLGLFHTCRTGEIITYWWSMHSVPGIVLSPVHILTHLDFIPMPFRPTLQCSLRIRWANGWNSTLVHSLCSTNVSNTSLFSLLFKRGAWCRSSQEC